MPPAPHDLPGTKRNQYQRQRQVEATRGEIGSDHLGRGGTHQTHCRDPQSDKAKDGPAGEAEARGDARGLDDP